MHKYKKYIYMRPMLCLVFLDCQVKYMYETKIMNLDMNTV